jgi:hypothetical protein
MENMTLRDELDGATVIEKNVDTPQEMEFSTPISDVIDHPVISQAIAQQQESAAPPAKKMSSKQQYPFNLKKDQVEALIAGLAGVIGFSDIIQNKVIDMIPQALNESGKLTLTGLGITAVIIAVIFYFLRQFILK